MQNYEQILSELGIDVPEDKKAELKKKMADNYKAISDYNNVVKKRDEYKTSLDDVQGKLDAFKDVDVDDLKTQIATLTNDLQAEKNARAEDARKAQQESTVSEFLNGKKFVNPITEKAIRQSLIEELDKDTAKGKSIEDIFKGLVTDADGNDIPNILVDEKQQQAQQQRAKFTTTFAGTGTGGTYTKQDFRKMNLDERLRLKQNDPELYAQLSQ